MKKQDITTSCELNLDGLVLSVKQCHAPNMIDVEEAYLSTNYNDEFEVVVSRPSEDAPGIDIYRHLTEFAGFSTIDWIGAAFLNFSFNNETEAREFANRLPKGMVTIYKCGKYFDINC